LPKYQPSYLILKREVLKSYSQFKKQGAINWEKMSQFIPLVQRKFFATINEGELAKLKEVRFERDPTIYHRNNLILDFLFYSGIRVSELTNLKHSDWEDNHLRVLGKGNKLRYVFLPEFLISQINPYSRNYLFLNSQGQPLTTEYIVRLIRKRTLLAVIKKKVTPHTFRRSFATLLNSKGARLTTIQKLLGHSNLETTASYIHNSWEELYWDYSRLWQNSPLQENYEKKN
jgi:site-specific recombinase XerD